MFQIKDCVDSLSRFVVHEKQYYFIHGLAAVPTFPGDAGNLGDTIPIRVVLKGPFLNGGLEAILGSYAATNSKPCNDVFPPGLLWACSIDIANMMGTARLSKVRLPFHKLPSCAKVNNMHRAGMKYIIKETAYSTLYTTRKFLGAKERSKNTTLRKEWYLKVFTFNMLMTGMWKFLHDQDHRNAMYLESMSTIPKCRAPTFQRSVPLDERVIKVEIPCRPSTSLLVDTAVTEMTQFLFPFVPIRRKNSIQVANEISGCTNTVYMPSVLRWYNTLSDVPDTILGGSKYVRVKRKSVRRRRYTKKKRDLESAEKEMRGNSMYQPDEIDPMHEKLAEEEERDLDDLRNYTSVKTQAYRKETPVYIPCIAADDLARSGLFPSIYETMRKITEAVLGNNNDAISDLLFPVLAKDEIYKRKNAVYVALNKQGRAKQRRAQYVLSNQAFEIDTSISPTSPSYNVMWSKPYQYITYYENSPEFIPRDQNSGACRAFRMQHTKDSTQSDHGSNSSPFSPSSTSSSYSISGSGSEEEATSSLGLLEQDSQEGLDTFQLWPCGQKTPSQRLAASRRDILALKHEQTMEENRKCAFGKNLLQANRLFNVRSVPNEVELTYGLPTMKEIPLVAFEYLKTQYIDKNTQRTCRGCVLKFPSETYRMIPIWMFPLVLQYISTDPMGHFIPSDQDMTRAIMELVNKGLGHAKETKKISHGMLSSCSSLVSAVVSYYQKSQVDQSLECAKKVRDIEASFRRKHEESSRVVDRERNELIKKVNSMEKMLVELTRGKRGEKRKGQKRTTHAITSSPSNRYILSDDDDGDQYTSGSSEEENDDEEDEEEAYRAFKRYMRKKKRAARNKHKGRRKKRSIGRK